MSRQDRAVTPVVSIILMVAIVVILASTVSVFFFDVTEDINEPAPVVGQTSGEFEPGADAQRVRITHIAGESIPVEELEVVVRASGPSVDAEARLVNLPAEGSDIDIVNIEGDTGIIDKGFGEIGPSDPNQVIIEDYPTDDNIWDPSETIQFAINVGGADFTGSNPDADELTVLIVHTPSEAVIVRKTFTP